MTAPENPSFNDINKALIEFGALGNASEIHGLLTALFCANAKIRLEGWLASLMNHKPDNNESGSEFNAKKILGQLFKMTEEALQDTQYSFQILVPSDTEDFETRIEGFAHWCQGFTSGLNLVGIQLKDQPIEEIQEALDDLVKFSCLRYDKEELGNEENEQAYAELTEYARVAIMLIYTEKDQLRRTRSELPGNETVH